MHVLSPNARKQEVSVQQNASAADTQATDEGQGAATGTTPANSKRATSVITAIRAVILENLAVSDWRKLEPGTRALVARFWCSHTSAQHRTVAGFMYRLGAVFVNMEVKLLPDAVIEQLCAELTPLFDDGALPKNSRRQR